MGCCCHKRIEINLPLEDSIFSPTEDEIGLKSIDSYLFDRVIHRYSYNNEMSKAQFKKATSELSITSKKSLKFLKRLKETDTHRTTKLNCLGILLGQGILSLKIKLLFQNYDLDTKGILTQKEVEIMLSDMISLSCRVIPEYALSQNRNNITLSNYVFKLRRFSNVLIKHYVTKIMENREEIDLVEFEKLFKDVIIVHLLRTRQLRNYAMRLYGEISEPAEIVMRSLTQIENENSQVYKIIARIERSKTAIVKSSSNSFNFPD